ncbi:MAG TPA: choice-of-anchor B family protein [Saprospiraceae bacterium]|nr:choice-of-anchor B family protein [Saprospiraceae bacterium]
MKNILLFLILLPTLSQAQISSNMTLLSNLDLPNLPTQFGCQYGDVWGYTYPNGNEVAIISTIEQIWFVNITSPANPVIILAYTVTNAGTSNVNTSLWRDFDTYQHYIYAVSDQQTSGLLIFDMGVIPGTINMVYQSNGFFNRSHTLFIDQLNKKLYAAGTDTQNNGLKILDLTNPTSPTLFASVPLNTVGGGYVHDVYVRDNIAFCSHGSLSKIQIYDFLHLPTSFRVVGDIANYPEPGYNHSSWISDDGLTLVFTDETVGKDVKIVDITDTAEISSNDIHTFFSELLPASAPGESEAHNPYIIGDLAFISYYEDGVQVFDISNHAAVTNVAYYDTYPSNTEYHGSIGCWGVYPFFPSGLIAASDMNNGLFVLQMNSNPLGIQYLSFDASRSKQDVKLAWAITDVSNGNEFEVKRSSDGGKTFTTVGEVDLIDHQSKYAYTDRNVSAEEKYIYRIDFLEFDGHLLSSPLRNISAQRSKQNFSIANPMSSTLTINVLNPVESLMLNMYDMDGRLVWSEEETCVTARMDIPIDGLIPAQYVLTMRWPEGDDNFLIQVVD